MGRGGGRSKASSTGTVFEAEAAFVPMDLNTTLIEFILSGHFESDYFSYCSNRLSDYTCRYWFNPNQSEEGKYMNTSDFVSPAFSMLSDASVSVEATGPVETHSEMLMRFTDPVNIPVSLTGGTVNQGWLKNFNQSFLLLNDLVPLSLNPTQQACSIVLCVVFLFSIFSTVLSWHCLRRLSNSAGLNVAKILVYHIFLECIDLFIEFNDVLMCATHGIPTFKVIEFLGRWSCQTLAMGYTCLKHTEGFLISILALDSLIFLRQMKLHAMRFRAEWAFNTFIFIIATMATTSSQFFWTFDLFHVDNRIPPSDSNVGGRMFIEPSLYMCGFSPTWGLSQAFTSYIWPALDHLIGDVFPCILPLIAGSVLLANRRNMLGKSGPISDSTSLDILNEFLTILPVLFLLHGFAIFPRMLFYSAKYFVFSDKYLNRVGLIFHREDNQRIGEGGPVTAIAKVIPFRQINPHLLPHLQDLEAALRFIPPIFALAKSTLIIVGFSKSRRILRTGLNRCLAFCESPPRSRPLGKAKTVPTSQISNNINHVESIPFTAFATNPIPRVEPAKMPMYINLGDVEVLAV